MLKGLLFECMMMFKCGIDFNLIEGVVNSLYGFLM